MEQLHKRALIAVNREQAGQLNREIEACTAAMNSLAASIRTRLSQLSKSGTRLALTQQRKLGKNFLETMKRFENLQSHYRSLYREQLRRQYLIVKPEATLAELAQLDAADHHQMLFSLANKAIAQTTLRAMQERHADVKNLERSVADLHQIFLEVQLVVNQQGGALDQLEAQIGETEGVAQAAAGEMQGAVQKKKSTQRRKWILLLVIVVVLGIVGIVLGVSLHNK